jgi:hypothetical protein
MTGEVALLLLRSSSSSSSSAAAAAAVGFTISWTRYIIPVNSSTSLQRQTHKLNHCMLCT